MNEIILDEENLVEKLNQIIEFDKTPPYQYGNGAGSRSPSGELPGVGARWMTPAEIARDMLRQISGE